VTRIRSVKKAGVLVYRSKEPKVSVASQLMVDADQAVQGDTSRVTAAEYCRTLTRIMQAFQDAAQVDAAIEDSLGRAAALLPGTILALWRVCPDTGETEFFAFPVAFSDIDDPAQIRWVLDLLLAQQPPPGPGTAVGRCVHFSVLPALLAQATGVQASRVEAFLSPVGRSGADLLLAVCQAGSELSDSSIDFLRSFLVSLQMGADSRVKWGRDERLHQRIQQAKREWEAVVDALPQLVCLLDQKGFVVRANRAVEELRLSSVKKIAGQDFLALLWQLGVSKQDFVQRLAACGPSVTPSIECAHASRIFRGILSGWGASAPGELLKISGLASAKGRVYDLTIQRVPQVADGDGAPGCCIAVLDDVTEQRRALRLVEDFKAELEREVAEKTAELLRTNDKLQLETEEHRRDQHALRLSEYRYHSFVDNTLTGIYLAADGCISYHNARFAELLGYGENELLGARLEDCLGRDCSSASAQTADLNFSERGQECLVTTRQGRRVWLYVMQFPFPGGERQLIVGNVLDVTASKEFEIRLVASNRRAAALSERLLVAQEQERRRLARELHDGIGQRLTSIKLMLENTTDQCALAADSPIKAQIGQLSAALRDTIEETRRVAMALRPSILDDLGIECDLELVAARDKQGAA
jgi:PAS domain S-box-containing protein